MNDMDELKDAGEVLRYVYSALKAKGHDPIMQLVGYIVSGDPTYITNHNSARSLIRRVERDELLEEFLLEEEEEELPPLETEIYFLPT